MGSAAWAAQSCFGGGALGSETGRPEVVASAMRASRTLSGQLPDQRSGALVIARPDEQFAPNKPILNALPLYIARRPCLDPGSNIV